MVMTGSHVEASNLTRRVVKKHAPNKGIRIPDSKRVYYKKIKNTLPLLFLKIDFLLSYDFHNSLY